MATETETELTAEQQAAAAANAAAEPAKAAAADTRTPEQKEADEAYQRAKFLHGTDLGPDPDTELIHTPDGADAQGKAKFKEWDFRKAAETEEEKAAKEKAEAAKANTETLRKEKIKSAKAKAEKKAVKSPTPAQEREELIARTAAATAAETARQMKEEKAGEKGAVKEEAEGFKLPPKEQRMLAVFHQMEKDDPTQKGLAGRHIAFWKKAADYASTWQAENQGKVFNPDDAEHSDFYSAHEPAYDEDAFEETKISIIAEGRAKKLVSEQVGKTNESVRAMEARQRMREELPQISEAINGSRLEMLTGAIPEILASVAGEEEFAITPENIAKLEAAEPLAYKVVAQHADELGLMVGELERLSRYPEAYPENPALAVELVSTLKSDAKGKPLPGSGRKVYPHRELVNFAQGLDEQLKADGALVEGKSFLTQPEWAKACQKNGVKATAAQHWCLSAADIRAALVDDFAARSKAKLEELQDLMGLAGKKSGGAAAGAASSGGAGEGGAAGAGAAVKPGIIKERVKAPSTASASDKMNAGGGKPLSEQEMLEAVNQAAFS